MYYVSVLILFYIQFLKSYTMCACSGARRVHKQTRSISTYERNILCTYILTHSQRGQPVSPTSLVGQHMYAQTHVGLLISVHTFLIRTCKHWLTSHTYMYWFVHVPTQQQISQHSNFNLRLLFFYKILFFSRGYQIYRYEIVSNILTSAMWSFRTMA